MTENFDDKTLLEHLCGLPQKRDEALRHLFLRSGWRESAKRILAGRGVSAADAEDCVSEAFIVLDNHVRNGRFDAQRGSLKNYFFGICVQLEHTRRRSQKRIVLPDEMPETSEFLEETPETLLLDEEKKAVLRKALDQLDEPCRELLRLYRLSFSMKEIREQLQISSDNLTRKNAFDCRKKLAKLLDSNPTTRMFFKN